MSDQVNKPGGDLKDDKARPVEDRQAVNNQSKVTPEDYPEPAAGSPDQTGKR